MTRWPLPDSDALPHRRLREVQLLGTRAAVLDRHLLHLLATGEIHGVVVPGARGPTVLVRKLTPAGAAAMLDASAADAEQRRSWRARAKRLARRAGTRIVDEGWKILGGVLLALVLMLLGLGSE